MRRPSASPAGGTAAGAGLSLSHRPGRSGRHPRAVRLRPRGGHCPVQPPAGGHAPVTVLHRPRRGLVRLVQRGAGRPVLAPRRADRGLSGRRGPPGHSGFPRVRRPRSGADGGVRRPGCRRRGGGLSLRLRSPAPLEDRPPGGAGRSVLFLHPGGSLPWPPPKCLSLCLLPRPVL